ncbi:ABC transporter ATP-binding protein [Gemelliphila palaticanis]|uniref:ABC transporter ATP-binding protein n=1 Tax=Gemelliphila palaticanis TaxID=81950 RepID=A0ABX2SX25_9BACL|nr:ABC transporter ATP-binding protein [Gemella palaticanis]MBF0714816.1 ABC transporter ATP-binding protein [Gemella palaticanis]NYS46746.1 ABC transporter ATP-binding protein [Gemella palaticanis]
MTELAMQFKNITKSYQDGSETRTILDKLNLEVKKGEFIAVVGPSGTGKSTFLSIAGALLSPDFGDIIIGGEKIESNNQKQWTEVRRNKIGFIFQNHQLLPYLTIRDQLALIQNLSNNKDDKFIDDMLDNIGLGNSKDKYPNSLSGGEKQRVAIARAFMNNPEVILADEPTASLDKERGYQIVEMIAKEVKRQNKAAIMVTHDERVLDLVDTIYYLEDKKLKLLNK